MGLLIGLPLKIFHFLFVILRFAWPVLVVLLVLWLRRRRQSQGTRQETTRRRKPKEPTFDGPVYTVDYEEVDPEEKK